MNNKFDELTKQMAQSVTRREALTKFGIGLGVGLAGLALACFGLANPTEAKGGGNGCKPAGRSCLSNDECCSGACMPALTKGSKKGYCLG
jgi:hypothetical protein